ncbi:MAG: hypothetical protein ABI120_22445 [Gemmatimonadaceae bacterium]
MTLDLPSAAPGEPSASTRSPSYDLNCSDPVADQLLREWLDGTRLVWPGNFKLTVHVGETNPFPPDTRQTFYQAGIAIQAGPDSGTVRVTWESPAASAEVHATLPEATIWLSPGAVKQIDAASRSFLLIVLVFVMRRLGWYHVHGAALIDPKGRGWLIAGDSNCGKSTTTALMATRGWRIGTDDIGFLAMRDDKVVSMGVRTRIALRPGGVALLGATGGNVMKQRQKEGFWPEELGGAWAPVIVPEIVAFPRIGERTAVERSTPRTALSNIVMWSHWVLYEPQFAQEHLDVLGKVARQSRCFDLTLGPDLFDNPDLLENLIPS